MLERDVETIGFRSPCWPITQCEQETKQEERGVKVVEWDIDVMPGIAERVERVL